MLVGVAAVVAGGFIIICAAPFASHRLYKAGGGLYLISGKLKISWAGKVYLFLTWTCAVLNNVLQISRTSNLF